MAHSREREIVIFQERGKMFCEFRTLIVTEKGFDMTQDDLIDAPTFDKLVEKIKDIDKNGEVDFEKYNKLKSND